MSHQWNSKFTFPLSFDLSAISNSESRVCVVAVIGKSKINPFVSKATPLNSVVDRDIFQGSDGYLERQMREGSIECFYDSDSHVVYLHVVSLHDINQLALRCQDIKQDDQEFYSCWQSEEMKHAKNLLFVFSVSHLILLCSPGSTFDFSYLKLFSTLDAVRTKLQSTVSETLAHIPGVSKDWASFGRISTPRVLFLFETTNLDLQTEEIDPNFTRKRFSPVRKLQTGLEEMIFRILRKTRSITNVSNNSLFSVPTHHQYVYVTSKRTEVSDPVEFILSQTRQTCLFSKDESPPLNSTPINKPRSYSNNRRAKLATPIPEPLPVAAPSTLSPPPNASKFFSTSRSAASVADQSLKEFLWQHIEMVFSKNVNDNVGRHGIEPIIEVPMLQTWLQAANSVFQMLFQEPPSDDSSPKYKAFHTLRSLLDVSMKFSENRCNKVLPMAENAYQQDLPQFYIRSIHLDSLSKAKRLFAQYARGPAYERFITDLESSCVTFWQNGRQQCESVSLTGNLCNNKVHRLPKEELESMEDERPVMDHSSGIYIKSACNCGRIQAEKEDPFSHKYSNYEFYQVLESACCGQLEHVSLPVFTPELCVDAASVGSAVILPHSSQQHNSQHTDEGSEKLEVGSTLSDASYALSLGQTALGTEEQEAKIGNLEASNQSLTATVSPCHVSEGAFTSRQHSTTEYLATMLTTKSPEDLLPEFSSFSLCRLGPASYYSHSMGLDLPGFLPGSNFLLPWDIVVKSEVDKWPSVAETVSSKKRQHRKPNKVSVDSSDTMTTVRVYLGMEYECPRGHRFFCSGPDKIIKISSNSIVKDNASRLVHMDMPLYTYCHCKQPKGCISQLMRVYVVSPRDTPNSPPVRVQIQPYIQAGVQPCPLFHTGLDEPQELTSDGVWVLRLPHIYQDDRGVYLPPLEPHQLHECCLQKGMFSYQLL